MGCYDPRDAEEEKHAREGMAACCELIKWLYAEGIANEQDLPPAVAQWWDEHQKRDRAQAACVDCAGTGKFPPTGTACPTCLGAGVFPL